MHHLDLETMERLAKALTRYAQSTREQGEAHAEIMSIYPDFFKGEGRQAGEPKGKRGHASQPSPVTPAPKTLPMKPVAPPASHAAIATLRKRGPMGPAAIGYYALIDYPELVGVLSKKAIQAAVYRRKDWFELVSGNYELTADAPTELDPPFGGGQP